MVHSEITVVITARGEGTRMKGLSPLPKHMLYYGGKRIIDCIRDCFEGFNVVVLDGPPTKSRAETLEELRGMQNVLIVDCDIIPLYHGLGGLVLRVDDSLSYRSIEYIDMDVIWYFISDCPKYGGLQPDTDGVPYDGVFLKSAKERGETELLRASGLYFLKDVGATIDRMTDPNSIASGMIGARMIRENTFIRVGDPEDYLAALA